MKLILYQATFAVTEIDFVPGPFRCQIEQQHLDFAVDYCMNASQPIWKGIPQRAGDQNGARRWVQTGVY